MIHLTIYVDVDLLCCVFGSEHGCCKNVTEDKFHFFSKINHIIQIISHRIDMSENGWMLYRAENNFKSV